MNRNDTAAPLLTGTTTALGFAIAVTMWGKAYVFRLPAVNAPGWLMLVLMLAAVVTAGHVAESR